jgi:hypothetical protein
MELPERYKSLNNLFEEPKLQELVIIFPLILIFPMISNFSFGIVEPIPKFSLDDK